PLAVSRSPVGHELFAARNRDALSRVLLRYIRGRRWFAGKARTVANVTIRGVVALPANTGWLTFVAIDYADGEPETYLLPLAITQGRRADEQSRPATLIARLPAGGLLYEPAGDDAFAQALLETIVRCRQLRSDFGTVTGVPARALKEL